jgi:FMN-dependent NADH-azoreductase
MPQKIEAITFVDSQERTLFELQVACAQAELETTGTEEQLRARLQAYLTQFADSDEIVCLNPEPPAAPPSR